MPTLDIFNTDAFSLSSLTAAVNDLDHLPGRIGELGLFDEAGITTTSAWVEKQGETLTLVPAAQRGAPGDVTTRARRTGVNFSAVHLPQRGAVLADQVQGIRAFGSETESQMVERLVGDEMARLRRRIDATLEYHRIGAVKGSVLDADGTTELLDIFTAFGLTQKTLSFVFATATTNIRNKCSAGRRLVEDALGGRSYTGLRAFCSSGFFDALTSHALTQSAVERWNQGEMLRADLGRAGNSFYFGGITFEEYRGSVNSVDFIAANTAYLVPEGVAELFIVRNAPADYVETVNTVGLPYYAKQELMRMGKGVDIEVQANPITLCTKPTACIKLTTA